MLKKSELKAIFLGLIASVLSFIVTESIKKALIEGQTQKRLITVKVNFNSRIVDFDFYYREER